MIHFSAACWRILMSQNSTRLLVFADQVLYSQIVSPPSEFFAFEVIL